MTPIDWATRPLKKYADFTGRATRAEFWWFSLATFIVGMIIGVLEDSLGLTDGEGLYAAPLSVVLGLALLVPEIAVTVRRLHDTNRSAWWMLIGAMPYLMVPLSIVMALTGTEPSGDFLVSSGVGFLGVIGTIIIAGLVCSVVVLVFMVQLGTPGANRYGPDPYAGETAATA